MTKEIKIGDKVFREGQIIDLVIEGVIPGQVRSFYIIEKICPKIVKARFYCWSAYHQPHQWRISWMRRIRREALNNYVPVTKVHMDNHIFHVESYST